MTQAAPDAPFAALGDLKIIDLTPMLAGAYGAMIPADHGAEVIKVEPLDGDIARCGRQFRDTDTERYADWPARDVVAQAMGAVMAIGRSVTTHEGIGSP
jgi:crotonobetainyl-CoA:carnitine CoA-transferase CaiB-like acyl-CoA transferase